MLNMDNLLKHMAVNSLNILWAETDQNFMHFMAPYYTSNFGQCQGTIFRVLFD